MARYYFDVREGEVRTADEVGTELERADVPVEARRLLLEISRDLINPVDRLLIEVWVRNNERLPVHWSSLLLERSWI